jgi:Flp pilus assembly protein TadG
MRLNRTHHRRRGMAIVESALVLSVFLMLLFGVFEYCRYLMVLHVTHNAARDGARYAAVNVNCPSDDILEMRTKIENYTKDRMLSVQKNFKDLKVAVYPCDSAGLALATPIVRSKSTNGSAPYPDPFGTTPFTPWNKAAFTERIAVTVKGKYKPIVPTLIFVPSEFEVRVTAVTVSEG